ncbi:ABC transporter ATP-binding protein [Neolewinella maritima]|uniref:ABC transporter ATP-binding protein n=1 Tax=Neolewinella maritima TaxID=1383882 RepID=UPI001EE934DB|nr:ATP-binding cassette domain-containing protein [Neolewinella maritima]
MTDLLHVSDLSLAYGTGTPLLGGLSFELSPGESVGIAGPSGSGKSLLTMMLLGLAPPAARVVDGHAAYQLKSGLSINLLATVPGQRDDLRGTEIGLVFQEPQRALNPVLTCGVQLREAIRYLCPDEPAPGAYLLQLLRWVELAEQQDRVLRSLSSQLSGGQLQRVLIAMALVGRPRLLIADEPTTALDGITEAAIVRLLDRLRYELQMGLLFITHDRALLERATDRVVELPNQQRIVPKPRPTPTVKPLNNNISLLKIEQLSVRYTPATAMVLQSLNLVVRRGEWIAITGPSGCGKSTLASWLVGLVEGCQGTFTVADTVYEMPLSGRAVRLATGAQLIFQDVDGSFNPSMTVRQHIASVPGNAGAGVEQLLQEVGLSSDLGDRRPDQLSGGQRQRAAIARVLATHPKLIIFDEAFSGLDVDSRQVIQDLLHALTVARGIGVMMITHSLTDITAYADRVLIMDHGTVVESGTPAAVFDDPQSAIGRKLVAAALLGRNKPKRP